MSHVYPKTYNRSDDMPNDEYDGLGYVYIIGRSQTGPVKVGISRNARKRVKELECAGGERFSFIWVSSQCFNYIQREKDLHEHMKDFRSVGEWFKVPFHIAVQVARLYSYKGLSRFKRVEALRDAANKVRPVPSAQI